MPLISLFNGKILAVHTDGITTTGAVFGRQKGMPKLLGQARSKALDPQDALADIIDALRADKVSVPKRVMLASDRAVMVRAELPVNPERPRPYAQMRELASWEAELGFSDLPAWDIGAILKAIGAVSQEADIRINEAMELRATQTLGGPAPRYQDVAVSLGEIDRNLREAAVELRERLNQPVGEPGCGWSAVQREAEGDYAQHAWLLAAIGEFDREIWRGACRENKLSLVGVLPSWGLTDFAARHMQSDPEDSAHQRLLLECHNGAISLIHMDAKAVESIRIVNLNHSTTAQEDALHHILERRQQTQLAAVGFDDNARAFIRKTFPKSVHLDDLVSATLAGAAARGLRLKKAPDWPPLIAAAEPRPPIWKSSNFYRAMMMMLVLGAIAGLDLSTRWNNAKLDKQLAKVEAQYEERRDIAGHIQKSIDRVDDLKAQVKTAQAEIADLLVRGEIAKYLQQRRPQVTQGLLEAIRLSIPNGVVMRVIEESDKVPEVFTLSAWSLTDIAAERFISRLNENLAVLDLVVADEAVFREAGPGAISGYGSRLRIAPKTLERSQPGAEGLK